MVKSDNKKYFKKFRIKTKGFIGIKQETSCNDDDDDKRTFTFYRHVILFVMYVCSSLCHRA